MHVDALFCVLNSATGARIIGMASEECLCEMSGKSNHHLSRDLLVLDHDEKWERFLRKCWPFVVKRGPITVHLLPPSFSCKMTKNSRPIIECSFNSNCRLSAQFPTSELGISSGIAQSLPSLNPPLHLLQRKDEKYYFSTSSRCSTG